MVGSQTSGEEESGKVSLEEACKRGEVASRKVLGGTGPCCLIQGLWAGTQRHEWMVSPTISSKEVRTLQGPRIIDPFLGI